MNSTSKFSNSLAAAVLALPFAGAATAQAQNAPISVKVEKTTIRESDGARASRVVVRRADGVTGEIRISVRLSAANGYANRVLQAPTQVLLPAGQDSAEFFISASENLTTEFSTRTEQLALSVAGDAGFSFKQVLTVLNATPFVRAARLSLTGTALQEGVSSVGTITLSRVAPLPVRLTLQSSDPRVTLPGTVTVAAGKQQVQFPVRVVSDRRSTGVRQARISIGGATGLQHLLFFDQPIEDTDIAFTLDVATRVISEDDGARATTGVIRLARPAEKDITFRVGSGKVGDQEPKVHVDEPVTVRAGTISATFNVAAVDNTLADGDRTEMFSAAPLDNPFNFTVTTVLVLDDETSNPASTVKLTSASQVNYEGFGNAARVRFSGAVNQAQSSIADIYFTIIAGNRSYSTTGAGIAASGLSADIGLPKSLPAGLPITIVARGLRDAEGKLVPVTSITFTPPSIPRA